MVLEHRAEIDQGIGDGVVTAERHPQDSAGYPVRLPPPRCPETRPLIALSAHEAHWSSDAADSKV